jgi:hypothetical protein
VEKIVEVVKPITVEVLKENPVESTQVTQIERVTQNPVVTTEYLKQQIEVPKINIKEEITERII